MLEINLDSVTWWKVKVYLNMKCNSSAERVRFCYCHRGALKIIQPKDKLKQTLFCHDAKSNNRNQWQQGQTKINQLSDNISYTLQVCCTDWGIIFTWWHKNDNPNHAHTQKREILS